MGRYDFGLDVGPSQSTAWGISGNGSVVVGGEFPSSLTGSAHPFRWSQAGGYQDLGLPTGFASGTATDANNDGSVIAGTLRTAGGLRQGFRWTESGGIQPLSFGTEVLGMSRDGSTIVGGLGTAGTGFRWTEAAGMEFFQPLGGTNRAGVSGVNFDGSIVVGNCGQANIPTRWINGVPSVLAPNDTSGINLAAAFVSDNGNVVAGIGQLSNGDQFAAVWTPDTGIVRLSDYLAMNGVVVPAGSILTSCTGLSADGSTFVGGALTPVGSQAFVATIPAPGASAILVIGAVALLRRRH